MDQELMEKLGREGVLQIEEEEGQLVVLYGPKKELKHPLKDLKDLYGKGVNAETVDPVSKEYLPLCLAIEEMIVQEFEVNPGLTDGEVSLALDRLAIKPEAAPTSDVMESLQIRLRLTLSLRDYSRQDVQRALRKINKSVERHTRSGGRQGYLFFIRAALG